MQIASKSQLKRWIDEQEDILLIDVLPKESFDSRHIPGAVNIPLRDNPDFVREVAEHVESKDQMVVAYCAGSQCPLSREAGEKLEAAGFTNVKAFEEGLEGWFGKAGQAAA